MCSKPLAGNPNCTDNARPDAHCQLQATPPFRFEESLWYLDRNFDDCMHLVRNGKVRRAIDSASGPLLTEVSAADCGVEVRILAGDKSALPDACSYVAEWLDLDRDLKPFYALLQNDSDFAPLAEKYHGFHMVGIPDLFECLIWCIAGQQISLPFAYTLKRRLVEAYGKNLRYENETFWLFPLPGVLARCTVDDLRRFQFTTRKCEYIIGISQAFESGGISKKRLLELGHEERMLKHLTGIRGIGPWTANYALMKSVRAMNRIPYGDAGVHQALAQLKGLRAFDSRTINGLFDQFAGWETYLVYYLWRSRREMA